MLRNPIKHCLRYCARPPFAMERLKQRGAWFALMGRKFLGNQAGTEGQHVF